MASGEKVSKEPGSLPDGLPNPGAHPPGVSVPQSGVAKFLPGERAKQERRKAPGGRGGGGEGEEASASSLSPCLSLSSLFNGLLSFPGLCLPAFPPPFAAFPSPHLQQPLPNSPPPPPCPAPPFPPPSPLPSILFLLQMPPVFATKPTQLCIMPNPFPPVRGCSFFGSRPHNSSNFSCYQCQERDNGRERERKGEWGKGRRARGVGRPRGRLLTLATLKCV